MTIVVLFIGVLTWTFLEYVIHRFLGHQKKENNPVTTEHHRHHREGDYFAPLWKKFLLAAIIVPALASIIGLFFGWANGLVFSIGLVGMYLMYETFHKLLHILRPLTVYGRWARRHHFYHHFKSPAKNHGVTSPLWDIIFGTYEPVKMKLRVPRKMAMTWLIEPKSNSLKERFCRDYELVG